jgi:intein/homing endonuclease
VGFYRLIWAAEHLQNLGYNIEIQYPQKPGKKTGKETGLEVHFRGDVRDDPNAEIIDVKVPNDADVLVMQRLGHNWHSRVIEILRSKGVAMVIDMDDDLSCIHPDNKAFVNYHPRNKQTPYSWKNVEQACKAATLVTVSTKQLLGVYARHGRGAVIDNYVPEQYLRIKVDQDKVFGWPGTTDSHPNDLQVTGGAVQQLVDDGYEFRVVGPVTGAKAALRLKEQPPHTGVVQMVNWASEIGKLQVALAPLAATQFNTGKCIDSAMRVSTDQGVLRAGELTPGMRVWRDGWKKIEAAERGPRRAGLLITTKSGYQLKLTPEHRMLVGNEWKRADQLAVGDSMTMEAESGSPVSYQTTPWPADSRMTRKSELDRNLFRSSADVPRLTISPRLGRLLGAFAGDGAVQAKTQICFSCDGVDQDWIDLLSDDIRALGLHPSTQIKTMYSGKLLRRRAVTAASAHLIRVLEHLDVVRRSERGSPIRYPCVPDIIWKSPLDVIAEFLAGYFEADGTVSGTTTSATSKSEQLIRDVHRLLLLFGIKARILSRTARAQNGFTGTYWYIHLNRAATDLFEKEIGFRSERKRQRQAAITTKPHSNAYRPISWADPVVSIEAYQVDPVDIQVEGEVFVLAGFVSHNSRLKAIEAASVGVPWVGSPRAEYRRFHQESGSGLLADNRKDWYRVVRQLMDDASMRQELGEKGREYMQTQTVEKNAWRLWDAWTRALEIQRGGGK